MLRGLEHLCEERLGELGLVSLEEGRQIPTDIMYQRMSCPVTGQGAMARN